MIYSNIILKTLETIQIRYFWTKTKPTSSPFSQVVKTKQPMKFWMMPNLLLGLQNYIFDAKRCSGYSGYRSCR
jgi:hypothetical protein